MINGATQLLNRLDEIVGIPSISSASDDLDMSNSPSLIISPNALLILASAARSLPVASPERSILLPPKVQGREAWCSPGTPIPCL